MPEPTEKLGDELRGSTVEGADGAAPDAGQTDQPYLATFKTRDDADKGWKAAQEEINRLRSEKDKALAKANRQDELLEKLTAIQEAGLKSGKPQSKPFDRDAFIKQWEEGDASFQVSALEQLLRDTATKEELEATRQELQQARAELKAQMGEYDPTYQSHRQTVAVLREQFPNMDRDTLVQFATFVDSQKSNAPLADEPPGTMATSRVSGSGSSGVQVTAEARELLNSVIPGGLRKGELEKLTGVKR